MVSRPAGAVLVVLDAGARIVRMVARVVGLGVVVQRFIDRQREGAGPLADHRHVVVDLDMHGGEGDVAVLVLDLDIHDERRIGVVLGVVAALVGVGVLDRLQQIEGHGAGGVVGHRHLEDLVGRNDRVGACDVADQRAARRIPGREHGLAGQRLEAGVAAVADAELDRDRIGAGRERNEAVRGGAVARRIVRRVAVADAGRQAVLVDDQAKLPGPAEPSDSVSSTQILSAALDSSPSPSRNV